eukprot:scaffold17065_cov63-Phaeocystis_antarctica.AAC.2
MINVRSSPYSAPNLQSSPPLPLHAACPAVARAAYRLPTSTSPRRMPSFRLSAVRVGVQPAAELRHVQGHRFYEHVRRAFPARACSFPGFSKIRKKN